MFEVAVNRQSDWDINLIQPMTSNVNMSMDCGCHCQVI